MGELEDREYPTCEAEDCGRATPSVRERSFHDGQLCIVCASARERADWEVDGDV